LRDRFFLPGHEQERLAEPLVLGVLQNQFEKIAGGICVLLGEGHILLISE
jgi:hypothetical protein